MKCGEVPAVLRIYFRRVNEMYSHYNRAIIVDMVHAYKHTCKHEQTSIHTYILCSCVNPANIEVKSFVAVLCTYYKQNMFFI